MFSLIPIPGLSWAQKCRYIARLITPFYVFGYLIEAVCLIDNGTTTQILGCTLLEGTYPDGFLPLGVEDGTTFPGPFSVVPDHPVIPWD